MENFLTKEVLWFLIGLVLFLAELALPGLVVLFFGIGAWITAICCLMLDISVNTQIFIFITTSPISLLLLRKVIRKKYSKVISTETGDLSEEYIGKTTTALTDFDKDGRGKVNFKGTNWDAISNQKILKGQTVRITHFESIVLHVVPVLQ